MVFPMINKSLPVFLEQLIVATTFSNITSAFESTGIFPFNHENVFKKQFVMSSETSNNLIKSNKTDINEKILTLFPFCDSLSRKSMMAF